MEATPGTSPTSVVILDGFLEDCLEDEVCIFVCFWIFVVVMEFLLFVLRCSCKVLK